jgi:hypothetical protein
MGFPFPNKPLPSQVSSACHTAGAANAAKSISLSGASWEAAAAQSMHVFCIILLGHA